VKDLNHFTAERDRWIVSYNFDTNKVKHQKLTDDRYDSEGPTDNQKSTKGSHFQGKTTKLAQIRHRLKWASFYLGRGEA